jgi:YVTN family beta-propeller protein
MFKYLYEENYMKSNMQFYKTTLVSVVIIFMLTGTAGAVPFACITNNVDGIITAIDTSNNSVKATIKVGSYPTGVAATADETMINAGDATWINEELKKNTGGKYTIPAGKYTVSGQIKIPENTVLQGTISESGKLLSTIYIADNYPSIEQEPIIKGLSGCKILYVDFNGNSEHQGKVPTKNEKKWGQGHENFIGFNSENDIEVAYCNFYNNLGDGLRGVNSKNIHFHHNTASKGGHDVFFAIRSEGVRVHDNYIQPRINSAIRLMDVNHARIYSNTIQYVPEYDGIRYDAGPSLQIQHDIGMMSDIEVCDNIFYDSRGPGLWLVGKTSGNEELWLHHNVFYRSGSNPCIYWIGGIIASGYTNAKIENNVFDGSHLGAIVYYAVNSEWATSAYNELNANVLMDSVAGTYNNTGGYGVLNQIREQKITSSKNCFYHDQAGDTKGWYTSSSDFSINPRTAATPSGWTWNGTKWTYPGIKPSEMGKIRDVRSIYATLGSITKEDIEEFEFSNYFGILNTK